LHCDDAIIKELQTPDDMHISSRSKAEQACHVVTLFEETAMAKK
jgi:hypothetical protein